jgi:hypothetical protein
VICRRLLSWACNVALFTLALVGCNTQIPTYPTHGKVVYKETGEPVRGGVFIWFESTSPPDHRASSAVDADGKFSLGFVHADSGTMEGEHRIRFAPAPPMVDPTAEEALAKRMHPRYLEYSTSGLKQTIAKGDNQFIIEVEGPP